jgi:hypothetical protein
VNAVHHLSGYGALAGVAVLIYLGTCRLLDRRRPPAYADVHGDVHAALAGQARSADGRLADLGHRLTWRWPGYGSGISGTCAGCGGVVSLTVAEEPGRFAADYGWPLAGESGGLLPCGAAP